MISAFPELPEMPKRPEARPRSWLLIILALGGVVLLLTGLLSLGFYFYLSHQERSVLTWTDPLTAVRPEALDPYLVLQPLAGYDLTAAINQALAEGAWDSAYALVVYSPALSDRQRAGNLLLLARYKDQGSERVLLCYQQVWDIAVLSPFLTDFVRADLLWQVAEGLQSLGATAEAREVYQNIRVIAEHSPALSPPHRQRWLSQLSQAFLALGDKEAADACAAKANTLVRKGQSQSAVLPSLPTLPQANPVLSPEIEQALISRQTAAQALVNYFASGNLNAPPTLILNLSQALQAENQARTSTGPQAAATQLAAHVSLAEEQVIWLTLKLQVASRGFGLSLVPEWEDQQGELRRQLAKAYEELYQLYGEQVVALPEAKDIDAGWAMILRQEALAGRLGLYPNYPESLLAEKLTQALKTQASKGIPGLGVELRTDNTSYFVFTSGREP